MELTNYLSNASIPHHNPLNAMSISTIRLVIIHQTIYLCLQLIFCGQYHVFMSSTPQNSYSWNICRINHFIIVRSQQNNMLSYIVLFTNECCHVITLVFLLPHFSLKFCLKFPRQHTGFHIVTTKQQTLSPNHVHSTLLSHCVVTGAKQNTTNV
jgi:hypothetical protein